MDSKDNLWQLILLLRRKARGLLSAEEAVGLSETYVKGELQSMAELVKDSAAALAYGEATGLFQRLYRQRSRWKPQMVDRYREPVFMADGCNQPLDQEGLRIFLTEELFRIKDFYNLYMAEYEDAVFQEMLKDRVVWLPQVYLSDKLLHHSLSEADDAAQLGKSCGQRHHIIIYYAGIKAYCSRYGLDDGYYPMASMVLAHEYFHTFHRIYDGKVFLQNAYPGVSVARMQMRTESMADFFATAWLQSNSSEAFKKVALHRQQLWNQSDEKWPYRMALDYQGSKQRLLELFKMLRQDPVKAYRLLAVWSQQDNIYGKMKR